MDDNELYNQVEEVINKDIKQFIKMHGGRINLVKVEDGVVYVKLAGACVGCSALPITLRYGVEHILKSKIDGVKSVQLAD